MQEIDIYRKMMEVAIAHKNKFDYKQINGFGVGYPFELNAENMEKAKFRSELFYAEKWFLKGKPADEMYIDYPLVLMLPVRRSGEIPMKKTSSTSEFKIVCWIVDLLYNDRNNNPESVAAKRSREEVFNDTSVISQEYLSELKNKFKEIGVVITNGNVYSEEKVYNFMNDKLAGSAIEFSIRVPNDCPDSEFDYVKTYTQSQSCN